MAHDCSLGSLPPARHPKKPRMPTGRPKKTLLAVNVRKLTKPSPPLKSTACRPRKEKPEETGQGEI